MWTWRSWPPWPPTRAGWPPRRAGSHWQPQPLHPKKFDVLTKVGYFTGHFRERRKFNKRETFQQITHFLAIKLGFLQLIASWGLDPSSGIFSALRPGPGSGKFPWKDQVARDSITRNRFSLKPYFSTVNTISLFKHTSQWSPNAHCQLLLQVFSS